MIKKIYILISQIFMLILRLKGGKKTLKPYEPLRILLLGYNGARNTGADARVEEVVRQLKAIFKDSIELSILIIGDYDTTGYFNGIKRQRMSLTTFPYTLFKECRRHHGVIVCEGYMFKSTFGDVLSMYLATGLGYANAEKKFSIGYGGEAGEMTKFLENYVHKVCKDSLLISRNESSYQVLNKMMMRVTSGADTAWTFSAPSDIGKKLLENAGWDGKKKILVACPINPYWWPVVPDLRRYFLTKISGRYKDEKIEGIFYHYFPKMRRLKYNSLIESFSKAINDFVFKREYFPVIIGMESLDRNACHDLASKINVETAIFTSSNYNMFELISILQQSSMVISMRYHAIITSMPALVPSAGILIDNRIKNILDERGDSDLYVHIEEKNLSEKILKILNTICSEQERITNNIAVNVSKQLQRMNEMGEILINEIQRIYPEFIYQKPLDNMLNYLPAIPNNLKNKINKNR